MKTCFRLAVVGMITLGCVLFVGKVAGASWQSDWKAALASANREGKVVVSIPASKDLRQKLVEAFEKKFPGIGLETFAGRGSKSIRRIVDEYKAGVHYFDVHLGGTSSIITGLVPENAVEPIGPFLILPEVKDPKNWWGGHIYVDNAKRFVYACQAYMSKNFYYNTRLVDPRELTSLDDLVKPKWKGKIGFLDPRSPGAGGSTWSFMWDIKGKKYLKELVQQKLLLLRNQRLLAESLADGKIAITVGLTYYSFEPFIKAGLPVKPLSTFKEGTYVSGGSGNLTIIKDPPHPNATKVFVNWLLSKEGQGIFSAAIGQATRRLDVDTTWLKKYGVIAAKDTLRPDDYYKYENQSEDKIMKVRIPARKIAKEMLQ